MDHCKDSENDIIHSILFVKLEPFDEDEDCTQNLDPLQPDSHVHTQMELLQDFNPEIESEGSNQAMNELSGTKIEDRNLKSEYIDNENSLDGLLDSRRIIEDNTIVHNQLSEKNSSTNTGEKNTTTYELNPSCDSQHSDVINEESTNDGSSLNVTSPDNYSRARSDPCSSRVDVLSIHKHSTSEEEGSKQSPSLIAHSLLHPLFECDVCDITFKNSRSLVKHKVYCKKGFRRSSHLTKHKIIRTDQQPFVCDICEKRFRLSHHLTSHKLTHTGHKPHVCDICKKRFSQSSSLVKHKRIHTGQKPYICDICKKAFSNSSYLARHKRIHTGQKPHVCDICEKAFVQASYLVRHKRVHTCQKPYNCDICKKGFSHSSNLITHKRLHTGQKPYICDICKKAFSDPSNLVAHKRIHAGQTPYV